MSIGRVMRRFAETTTVHGVPHVINAKSTMGRIFWSIMCIGAGSLFCINTSELFLRYFSFPKKVTVEVVPVPVPFPAISLCSMRNLDAYILNKINSKFLHNMQPQHHLENAKHPFIREYMKILSKISTSFYKYNEANKDFFQDILSRTTFSANLPQHVLASGAVQLKGFVVLCMFAGNNCNVTEDFSRFFDPYYFNCFTYNIDQEIQGSLSEGIENGWSSVILSGDGMLTINEEVMFLPGTQEYRSAAASSEGVRVVIHPPNTEPFPFTEGYDVPPGFSASFGIRPRKNIRVHAPHGNCSNYNPFGDGTERYRLMACQKMCLQDYVIQNCGCAEVSLPTLPNRNVTWCRSNHDLPDACAIESSDVCMGSLRRMYQRMQCARKYKREMTKNKKAMQNCNCFPPCDEIAYDVSYSLAKWPANGYQGDAAYYDIFNITKFNDRFHAEERDFYVKFFDVTNRHETMRNFARLNVYVADSNVVKTEESEDYSSYQLMSDIGGQLGLWVGISVISLAEVVELVCYVCRFCCKRATASKKQQTTPTARATPKFNSVPTRPTRNQGYIDMKPTRLANYNNYDTHPSANCNNYDDYPVWVPRNTSATSAR